jgi:saccharopine dehydrogenase (NAD+, L-lysine-forming)
MREMKKEICLGLIRETKNPPDRRIVLSPAQAVEVMEKFPQVEVVVQPSSIRAFRDEEYAGLGIRMSEDMSECQILMGVKEVSLEAIIPNKTFLFFSHTIKKQPYNQRLLQKCMESGITLIDHELLTDSRGNRVVAFGRWAGMVGAYNGLIGYGIRSHQFRLKRASECHDRMEMFQELKNIRLPNLRILVTGGGRVAQGAMETLGQLNLLQVSPEEFLNKQYDQPIVCRLDPWDYVIHKDRKPFDFEHFVKHPDEFQSTFLPFTKVTDYLIPCHFWDPASPVFFSREDMLSPDFAIQTIADVSCDVNGPIPSTIRASTIADPFYGYDPKSGLEADPWNPHHITVMAIDNLPGELPRDAAEDFGRMMIDRVLPSLFGTDPDQMIARATILEKGLLTDHFGYLRDYAEGR